MVSQCTSATAVAPACAMSSHGLQGSRMITNPVRGLVIKSLGGRADWTHGQQEDPFELYHVLWDRDFQ